MKTFPIILMRALFAASAIIIVLIGAYYLVYTFWSWWIAGVILASLVAGYIWESVLARQYIEKRKRGLLGNVWHCDQFMSPTILPKNPFKERNFLPFYHTFTNRGKDPESRKQKFLTSRMVGKPRLNKFQY